MNIVLIGFMGTGKSAVGRSLAQRLGRKLIETDALIEQRTGKSVPAIFREEGELRFRELEIEAVKEASSFDNAVIACGGGAVLNRLNVDRLRRNGVTVLLDARPEDIVTRLSPSDNERPLLPSPTVPAVRELVADRAPFYNRAADITVNTTARTVSQVVEEVVERLSLAQVHPIGGPLEADLEAPRSRSFTNRAVLIAALASGTSVLRDVSTSEDTLRLLHACRSFGIQVKGGKQLAIKGSGGRLKSPRDVLYTGNAGTAMRFLVGVAALADGKTVLNGDRRMRERPIQDLLDALRPLGVHAYSINDDGCPPVVVEGGNLEGGPTVLRGETSSQFLSSILMIAPYASKDVTVRIEGELTSKPYVDMTIALMNRFNVEVANEGYHGFTVRARRCYVARELSIDRDAANAAYLLGAAAVAGGRVRVSRLRPSTPQGEARFAELLARMGCLVERGEDWIQVRGRPLSSVSEDMNSMPDAVQTLAVVAAFAEGRTIITNVANLEQKETRRLTATVTELRKLGVAAGLVTTRAADGTTRPEGLWVDGGKLHGGEVETYGDHRMAMSFALAGLRVPGIRIKDPSVVSKSYPEFWQDLQHSLGVRLETVFP